MQPTDNNPIIYTERLQPYYNEENHQSINVTNGSAHVIEEKENTFDKKFQDYIHLADEYIVNGEYDEAYSAIKQAEKLIDWENEEQKEVLINSYKTLFNKSNNPKFIAPLLSAVKEKAELETKLETEKSLFLDLIHTFVSVLGTTKESDNTIKYLNDYKQSLENEDFVLALGSARSVKSSIELINGLLNMFRMYIKTPEDFRKEWFKDTNGNVGMEFLFASVVKYTFSTIIYNGRYKSEFIRIINSLSNSSYEQIQESFSEQILTKKLEPENSKQVLCWIEKNLPIVNFSIAIKPMVNLNKLRYNFLFSCFSELFFNALKYADLKNPISIEWKEEQEVYSFTCENSFDKNVTQGTIKGLYYVQQICSLIDGIDFNYKNDSSLFYSKILFKKSLFQDVTL